MDNIFLIFGYGIPPNILKDDRYNLYLKLALNRIYSLTLHAKTKRTLIVFCGGNTDLQKPYQRTEADEMIRLFRSLINQESFLAPLARKWTLISENRSLSTLENLLNSRAILRQRKVSKANVCIFCEQTRERRIRRLSKRIFGPRFPHKVIAIDFDTSPNRYLPPKFIAEKENAEIKHSLWALRCPENLKKHHQFFEEKLEFLRKAGPSMPAEKLRLWWEEKIRELHQHPSHR